MRILAASSADEMIAEFLRAEVHSSRFQRVGQYIAVAGLSLDQVERPNLADSSENQRRSIALSMFRGWPVAALFDGWPQRATWHRAALGRDEFSRLFYADVTEWRDLSGGSLIVADAARRLREHDPTLNEAGDHIQAIRAIAERTRRGDSFPLPIATGPENGDPIVLVEGHARMTAYLVAGPPEELEIIYATAPLEELQHWRWFPKPWPRI